MISSHSAGTILTVDLNAVVENWNLLNSTLKNNAICGATVKADAYGLGAQKIAYALKYAGCKHFFVAHVFEGIELRNSVKSENIYVLNGVLPNTEKLFEEHNLIPVINNLEQLHIWREYSKKRENKLKAIIHVDTGMTRLGMMDKEFKNIMNDKISFSGIEPIAIMSHLACADEPEHPKNLEQLLSFEQSAKMFKQRFPKSWASFAASAGILLGKDYQFDVARPGIALYGGNPRERANEPNPIKSVVTLKAKILEVIEVDAGHTIGYGARYKAKEKLRVATAAIGYGDGISRRLDEQGFGYIGVYKVPFAGRLSMDLSTFDVSDVPENKVIPGEFIEIIGKQNPIENLARACNTINYDILVNLGRRCYKDYINGSEEK